MSRATLEHRAVAILETAEAPLDTVEVAELLGTTRGAAHSALWRMMRAGCVRRVGQAKANNRVGGPRTLWGVEP